MKKYYVRSLQVTRVFFRLTFFAIFLPFFVCLYIMTVVMQQKVKSEKAAIWTDFTVGVLV